MKTKISHAVAIALLWFLGALMVLGCEKKNDVVSQTEKTDKINGVAFLDIEETKRVAHGSSIYGLPLTMHYGAAYELVGAPISSQFKAMHFGEGYSVWG
jgi:hypothetical protein